MFNYQGKGFIVINAFLLFKTSNHPVSFIPDDFSIDSTLGDNGKMQRTQQYRQFHENIVAYNNSVLFASEGVDNIDRAVAPFTFRVQGNIYH